MGLPRFYCMKNKDNFYLYIKELINATAKEITKYNVIKQLINNKKSIISLSNI